MRDKITKAALAAISLFVGCIIAEGVCRLIFNSMDILSPVLVSDAELGHHIEPGSGGHDTWGFRNFSVPDSADVVVIGDSQTWGVNARTNESFPYQLGRITEKQVYNFGVSGYGPVQYQYILEKKALNLKPSTVVVAFYLGNDFDDASKLVYTCDYWKDLRIAENKNIFSWHSLESKSHETLSYRALYWLNHYSVFYRFLKSRVDFIIPFAKDSDDNFVRYTNEVHGIDKYFNPSGRLSVMDCSDPKIQEGLRISNNCIKSMKAICDRNNIELIIVIIPTDITVYSSYLYNSKGLRFNEKFDAIIDGEKSLKSQLVQQLKRDSIDYIDVTDSLRAHTFEIIYPKYEDGHPSPRGYQIIAEAVAAKMD